jgi:hypothetical protein
MKSRNLLSIAVAISFFMCWSCLLYAQTADTTAPAATQPSELDLLRDFVNSPQGGSQHIIVPGAARAIYQFTKIQGQPNSSNFTPTTLFAIPCIRVNDRLFLDFAAELDVTATGAVATFDELVVYYRINPYMQILAGSFNPKFGMYLGVLDDFTNRFGTAVAPVGMGHGPQSQNGIGIQGAFQAGYTKFHYQVYTANGPQLSTDTVTGGQVGYSNYNANNNKAFTYGGELGWLPFSNSCLELTAAATYKGKTGNLNTPYEKISNSSFAVAANYYHMFSPIMVRLIGEYDYINTSKTNYPLPASLDSTKTKTGTYTFTNTQNGWFAGITLKWAGARSIMVRNFEVGGRLSQYNPPADALWGGKPTNQTTLSLTYWVNWDIPLTVEYDHLAQSGQPTQDITSLIVFYRF